MTGIVLDLLADDDPAALLKEYECDGCGACCKRLIVEAVAVDAIREPRVLRGGVKGWKTKTIEELAGIGKVVCLAWPGDPCSFLGDDNRCGIYATRPTKCVGFLAGSDKCQQVRAECGLDSLGRKMEADV